MRSDRQETTPDFFTLTEFYLDLIESRLDRDSPNYYFDFSNMAQAATISDLLSYPSGAAGNIYCLRAIGNATNSSRAERLANQLFELSLLSYQQNRSKNSSIYDVFALADLSISRYGKLDSNLKPIILQWMDNTSNILLNHVHQDKIIPQGFAATDLISGICRGILLSDGNCTLSSLELLQELLMLESRREGKRAAVSFGGPPSLVWAEKAMVASHRNYGIVHGLDGVCVSLCAALACYRESETCDANTYRRALLTIDEYLEWRIDSANDGIDHIPMTELFFADGSTFNCLAEDGIWCYGGSGLLGACSARLHLDYASFYNMEEVRSLIDRVVRSPIERSATLCHGEAGRILTLRNLNESLHPRVSQTQLEPQFFHRLDDLLMEDLLSSRLDPDLIFPNEPVNIGVLAGLSGVLIAYFEMLCETLTPSHVEESCLLMAPWIRPYGALQI